MIWVFQLTHRGRGHVDKVEYSRVEKERLEMKFNVARLVVSAMVAVGAVSASASAELMSISGDVNSSIEGTGVSFDGMLDYSFDSGSIGTLSITLNNSSNASLGGYLTGFVFNILSSDALANATLMSTSNVSFLDTGEELASPFGMFAAGAALGANWLGGGTPSFGLGVGQSGTFEFQIQASDASLLSAESFVGNGSDFAVRFRGLNDGGSDKLLAPSPGTGAIALLGLGLASRRRR